MGPVICADDLGSTYWDSLRSSTIVIPRILELEEVVTIRFSKRNSAQRGLLSW